jgi:predicted RNase H-like nuclease (RuvC/YqgF family)
MEQKNLSTINLSRKQLKDVEDFCKLNQIEDVEEFLIKCFIGGYEIEKYGLLQNSGGSYEKWVEKEVIVEKRVEVPVEVIIEKPIIEYVEVEKEVIKEVPVERVFVKEVPVEVEVVVEKEVYITDDKEINELLSKIQQLENGMSKKDEELDELRRSLDELLAKPPVEIIKEIPTVVEKTTVDTSKQKALEETIQKLRTELQLKNKEIKDLTTAIQEMQSINGKQSVYLEGSNLNRTINRR